MVTLNGVPAVWVETESKVKWSRAPAVTVNVFDVPVLPEAVAVIESVPVVVSVTDWLDKTPAVKLELVVGEIPPSKLDNVIVPVNDVAVLLFASWATILMLKATPEVWVAILPPEVFVTTK